ncbi:MAG TPA: SRPBCC domain-containing protein [Longimicrobiaceae bacterium]
MRRAVLSLAMVAVLSGGARAQDADPIVSEAVVDAPVDSVWAAWTTGDGLRSWLAPHAEIDLRVGGRMRTNYGAQGSLGDPQTIENTVLSFDPGRMLSIQVSRTPERFPFPGAIRHMWTVVYLDPVGADRTRVRVVGLGFRPDAESQRMREFFRTGNAMTLQQLQRRFPATRR